MFGSTRESTVSTCTQQDNFFFFMGKYTECNWGYGIHILSCLDFSAKKSSKGSGCSTVVFGRDYRFSEE